MATRRTVIRTQAAADYYGIGPIGTEIDVESLLRNRPEKKILETSAPVEALETYVKNLELRVRRDNSDREAALRSLMVAQRSLLSSQEDLSLVRAQLAEKRMDS